MAVILALAVGLGAGASGAQGVAAPAALSDLAAAVVESGDGVVTLVVQPRAWPALHRAALALAGGAPAVRGLDAGLANLPTALERLSEFVMRGGPRPSKTELASMPPDHRQRVEARDTFARSNRLRLSAADPGRPWVLSLFEPPPGLHTPGAIALAWSAGQVPRFTHRAVIPAKDARALAASLITWIERADPGSYSPESGSSVEREGDTWSLEISRHGSTHWVVTQAREREVILFWEFGTGDDWRRPPAIETAFAPRGPAASPSALPAVLAEGHALAASLRPEQLAAAVLWRGAMQASGARPQFTPRQWRDEVEALVLATLLRGGRVLAAGAGEWSEHVVALRGEADGVRARTYSAGQRGLGATLIAARQAGARAFSLRSESPIARGGVALHLPIALKGVKVPPVWSGERARQEVARELNECGPGCTATLAVSAPLALLRGLAVQFGRDLGGTEPLPAGVSWAITADASSARPTLTVAGEFPDKDAFAALSRLLTEGGAMADSEPVRQHQPGDRPPARVATGPRWRTATRGAAAVGELSVGEGAGGLAGESASHGFSLETGEDPPALLWVEVTPGRALALMVPEARAALTPWLEKVGTFTFHANAVGDALVGDALLARAGVAFRPGPALAKTLAEAGGQGYGPRWAAGLDDAARAASLGACLDRALAGAAEVFAPLNSGGTRDAAALESVVAAIGRDLSCLEKHKRTLAVAQGLYAAVWDHVGRRALTERRFGDALNAYERLCVKTWGRQYCGPRDEALRRAAPGERPPRMPGERAGPVLPRVTEAPPTCDNGFAPTTTPPADVFMHLEIDAEGRWWRGAKQWAPAQVGVAIAAAAMVQPPSRNHGEPGDADRAVGRCVGERLGVESLGWIELSVTPEVSWGHLAPLWALLADAPIHGLAWQVRGPDDAPLWLRAPAHHCAPRRRAETDTYDGDGEAETGSPVASVPLALPGPSPASAWLPKLSAVCGPARIQTLGRRPDDSAASPAAPAPAAAGANLVMPPPADPSEDAGPGHDPPTPRERWLPNLTRAACALPADAQPTQRTTLLAPIRTAAPPADAPAAAPGAAPGYAHAVAPYPSTLQEATARCEAQARLRGSPVPPRAFLTLTVHRFENGSARPKGLEGPKNLDPAFARCVEEFALSLFTCPGRPNPNLRLPL